MLLITTGGTIDMHRDPKQNMVAPLRHSSVPDTLKKFGLTYNEHITLCSKDARDLDVEDIDKLINVITTTNHNHIIVTHGYQTLANTITLLQFYKLKKNIIFVDNLTPGGEKHLQIACKNNTPGINITRNNKIINYEEFQKIQYNGKIISKWCI